jgi:CRP-like cAMP-binding protein
MTPDAQAEAEAFPSLTDRQIARIRRFSTERDLADGERLWEAGDRNRPLYVVVTGDIEILTGQDHVVTVHRPGAFARRARGLSRRIDIPKGEPRWRKDARTWTR